MEEQLKYHDQTSCDSEFSLLSAIGDASIAGIVVLKAVRDEAGRIYDFNCQLMNRQARLLTANRCVDGKNYSEVFPEFKSSGMFDDFVRVTDTGSTIHTEKAYRLNDLLNWFEIRITKFDDGVIVSSREITEQKLQEEQLLMQLNILSHSETIADMGSWEYDIATQEMKWSDGMYRLFNIDPGQKIDPLVLRRLTTVEDQDKVNQVIDFITRLRVPFEETISILPADSGRKIIRMKAVVLYDLAGKPEKILGFVHNITEMMAAQTALRELNEELHKTNMELERVNEDLSTFAFVASHDLVEPLRKIKMFSNRIIQSDGSSMSDSAKDDFSRILSAEKRMEALLQDVLSFSRISSDGETSEEVPLDEILKLVMEDQEETIVETGAKIETMPLPVLKGNRNNFIQLFSNLLSNSLKYVDDGVTPHIRIHYRVVAADSLIIPGQKISDRYHCITVMDNGIGFDAEYASIIFQMFQRLHGVNEFPGTGIGLAICKKIMEKYKGFITAESPGRRGAIFACYFPAA